MAKILDVDFKKKRLNFSFEDAVSDQKVKEIAKKLAEVTYDIEYITRDPIYMDWIKGLFRNIVQNLRDR